MLEENKMSLLRSRFNLRPVHVGFVLDNVTRVGFFLPSVLIFPSQHYSTSVPY